MPDTARQDPIKTGIQDVDDETKALLRRIAHHQKWVIALLVFILAFLVTQALG